MIYGINHRTIARMDISQNGNEGWTLDGLTYEEKDVRHAARRLGGTPWPSFRLELFPLLLRTHFPRTCITPRPPFNQGNVTGPSGANLGHNGLRHSGDGTVPYMSLAWSHAWHVDSKVHVEHKAERMHEYYGHLLGRWCERNVLSLMNSIEPETLRYASEKVGFGEDEKAPPCLPATAHPDARPFVSPLPSPRTALSPTSLR